MSLNSVRDLFNICYLTTTVAWSNYFIFVVTYLFRCCQQLYRISLASWQRNCQEINRTQFCTSNTLQGHQDIPTRIFPFLIYYMFTNIFRSHRILPVPWQPFPRWLTELSLFFSPRPSLSLYPCSSLLFYKQGPSLPNRIPSQMPQAMKVILLKIQIFIYQNYEMPPFSEMGW